MLSLKAAVPLAALTLAAVAGAAPAHADHEDDVRAVANVVAMFAYPVNEIVAKGTAGVVYKHVGDEAECRDAVAAAKKAGVTATDRLTGSYFKGQPGATEVDGAWGIPFSGAPALCDRFAAVIRTYEAAKELGGYADGLRTTQQLDPVSMGDDFGKGLVTRGEACRAMVDQAIKGGADGDLALKLNVMDEPVVSLNAGRKAYCDGLIDYGKNLKAKIAEAKAARRAAIAKKYEAAGIKGDRLELFIEYDDVSWRGKGCEIVDDLAVLAKAKKLYQWLENADGTDTIRTYTFSGDKYKVSDKRYKKEKDAYKGCK